MPADLQIDKLNEATPLLQLSHVSISSKKTPTRLLVNDVSFSIDAGKTTCVVGESGSGKSLTALSILGLLSKQLQLNTGKVLFNDTNDGVQDLTLLNETSLQKIRGAKIAMIFQEPMTSLNPVLTVGYQIGESLTTHL
ncbi:MAG: ATP-binding cassette domain-containing protein, partial [Methylotenera sp.]|nr:ATP-binding cassette domain-containing protein [Methylotenera sp.]